MIVVAALVVVVDRPTSMLVFDKERYVLKGGLVSQCLFLERYSWIWVWVKATIANQSFNNQSLNQIQHSMCLYVLYNFATINSIHLSSAKLLDDVSVWIHSVYIDNIMTITESNKIKTNNYYYYYKCSCISIECQCLVVNGDYNVNILLSSLL